jgi:hypothetical protein
MEFTGLCWLFVLALTVHNIEEAIYLPAWSKHAERWHRPVNAAEFRFAVTVITVAAYVLSGLVTIMGKQSVPAYLMAGVAFTMLLNIVIPHGAATLLLRRYAPGLATALLLNLPASAALLYVGFQSDYISLPQFLWSAPLVALAIVGSLPLLFWIGRQVKRRFSVGV